MARWAGSGEDWIQKWRTSPRRKVDMILPLVLAIHLSPSQIKKTEGGFPLRKERELDPLVLEPPRIFEGIELVFRGDRKTNVLCSSCCW